MRDKKKKTRNLNVLQNINTAIIIIVFIVNVVLFYFLAKNKALFIKCSIVANIYIFFLHTFLLFKSIKNKLTHIKNEASYTNYGLSIISFILCTLTILLMSTVFLFLAGENSLNISIIGLFYISILAMFLPSIVLIAYCLFIVPSLVVPNLTIKSYSKANSMSLLAVALILFSIFCICKYMISYLYANDFLTQIKYKVDKIPVEYSDRFLKIDNKITEYERKLMGKKPVDIPFLFTTQGFFYKDYSDAKTFCDSMGARVPTHLEMFNIAFHKFNTFGENYYWTSTNETREPYLIHFKNMSYSLEKQNKKAFPLVYCVSDMSAEEKANAKLQRNYFIRNVNKHISTTTYKIAENTGAEQQASIEELMLLSQLNNGTKTNDKVSSNSDIETDKKHVVFSIKEVSPRIMQSLINKGYAYSMNILPNKQNKIIQTQIPARIVKDANKKQIRLCYYPFIDYGTMTIKEEAQIWQQSFCSPSFELVRPYPQPTTIYEKDSFCETIGGRLPNIPELVGILRTLSSEKIGIKYWTNNTVTSSKTGIEMPIAVHFKDSRFLVPNMATVGEQAYAYCIRESKKPSKLITNYQSKFSGLDGKIYAKSICPNCHYNELPDTILKNN